MARDKGQLFIFTDNELQLIKDTFAENEALIYSIRKVLLQFPLTPAEKEMVKLSMTPAVFAVVKKRVFPDIDPDAPLGQIADYRTLLTQDLKTKPLEDVALLMEAMDLELKYLDEQFEVLRDIDGTWTLTIELDDLRDLEGKDAHTRFVDLKAYLDIIGYVDPMLMHLMNIAGQKTETVQGAKDRMKRDSNK